MAEELAHDMAVLAFHQGVVVAVPGAGLGELDAQFLQQPGDPVVDIVRAVVGMESQDHERKGLQQVFQGRDEIHLADALDTDHDLEPGHLIYRIDMIDAFFPVYALVHGIDTDSARLTVTLRLTSFADVTVDRTGLLHRVPLTPVGLRLAQVVQVGHRDTGQALILGLAEHLIGALTELLQGQPVGVLWRSSMAASRRMSALLSAGQTPVPCVAVAPASRSPGIA